MKLPTETCLNNLYALGRVKAGAVGCQRTTKVVIDSDEVFLVEPAIFSDCIWLCRGPGCGDARDYGRGLLRVYKKDVELLTDFTTIADPVLGVHARRSLYYRLYLESLNTEVCEA